MTSVKRSALTSTQMSQVFIEECVRFLLEPRASAATAGA